MIATGRRASWWWPALLAAAAYVLIGHYFALPRTHGLAWRRAAWLVSGAVFATQIAYDLFRLRGSPRSAALHAAVGSAIGAFGLAFWAMLRSYELTHHVRPVWRAALVLWPTITALPAFLVAWVAAVALKHVARPDSLNPSQEGK